MKPRGYDRCPVVHKIRYPRKKVALTALNDLKRKGSPVRRVYQCPHCHDWHLTRLERS